MTRYFWNTQRTKKILTPQNCLISIILVGQRFFFFCHELNSILSSVNFKNFWKSGQKKTVLSNFLKTEDKSMLLEDRGQMFKIEDCPLKTQADGHPRLEWLWINVEYIQSTYSEQLHCMRTFFFVCGFHSISYSLVEYDELKISFSNLSS